MKYIGDHTQIDNIIKLFAGEKKHHAVLLSGKKGIGKSILAREAVNKFIEQEKASLIYNLKWIDASENKSKQISVEQIREIQDFLNQTNFDGKARFVVIDAADDLNLAAANSLLKPLEEPGKNLFFILINHHPSNILPTIKSRCINLRVKEPNRDQIAKIVTENIGADIEVVNNAIILSAGNIQNAIYLIEFNLLELYDFLLNQFMVKHFDYIAFTSLVDNNQDNWRVKFLLLKRFLYILINPYTDLILAEKQAIRGKKLKEMEYVAKLIEEIEDMEYKISNLFLNKFDCFQVYCLKVHRLCQRIFI